MSVSPLTKPMLDTINPALFERLKACKTNRVKEIDISGVHEQSRRARKKDLSSKSVPSKGSATTEANALSLGDFVFETVKIKGKKTALLPLEYLTLAVKTEKDKNKLNACANLRGQIQIKNYGPLMDGEKMGTIINAVNNLDLMPIAEKRWSRNLNANIYDPVGKESLIDSLDWIMHTAIAKQKNKNGS